MVKAGTVLERETSMMAVRWNHFKFTSQIPMEKQRQIPPCGRCFAALLLENAPQDPQDE